MASPNIKQTQAKNKETNQRVGQLPAGPQWNCDTELCQQFSPWMDPFQQFPANYKRRHLNPSKQSMAAGVFPPDHPVRRDAEWVATPEETLSGDLPGCFVVWSHRQHSHTSQPNIIESRGSHRRKEERGRRRRRRFIQHNISNTPTCLPPTICDVMCHPDRASMKNCRYQKGSLPP